MAGKKRSTNEKAKLKRARSWTKNQEAKKLRIADQEARHAHNVKVGTTGKQRANLAAKQVKALDALTEEQVSNLTEEELEAMEALADI